MHFLDAIHSGHWYCRTTIVTFLMVFLIQNSQNRDTIAIHVKLDEVIRAVKEARNSVMNLEDLDEAELRTLLAQYQKLATSDSQDAASPSTNNGAAAGVTACPLDQ